MKLKKNRQTVTAHMTLGISNEASVGCAPFLSMSIIRSGFEGCRYAMVRPFLCKELPVKEYQSQKFFSAWFTTTRCTITKARMWLKNEEVSCSRVGPFSEKKYIFFSLYNQPSRAEMMLESHAVNPVARLDDPFMMLWSIA